MKIHLEKRWTERLTALPEDGMGYQRVRMTFADGRVLENVVVFNAEEAEIPVVGIERLHDADCSNSHACSGQGFLNLCSIFKWGLCIAAGVME